MMGFNSSREYEAWIEDGIRRGLDVASLQLDLLTLPTGCILSSFLDDFIDEHPESLKPHSKRAFIFYASYLDTYETLKEVDHALAHEYLEALLCYGVRDELPKDINPYIKALMLSPMKTIDKAWRNYLHKSAGRGKEHEYEDQR